MYDINKEMLKDILSSFGPAGRESTIANTITKFISGHADEIYTDNFGNLIAHKKGTSGKKIMFSAHMDSIGLIVVNIDDNGFLRVARVGGVNPTITIAREVVFENGVRGVTFYENKTDTAKTTDLPKMFIDIGAKNKEEAQQHVHIGDMAVYASHFVDMGSHIACGAIDNRICTYILVESLLKAESNHDLYFVFTAQEEVGCRGAGSAAYAIEPDIAINLDTTIAADTPNGQDLPMELDKGAAIKVMDSSVIIPVPVINFLEDTAKKYNITYQFEVLRSGGTDTGSIIKTKGGIPSGCISIPTRYIHTPIETASFFDVKQAIDLVLAVMKEYK